MSLESLTQITEVGIKSGITLRNINVEGAYVSGVITATSLSVTVGTNFAGVVTATSFSGNVTGNVNATGVSTFSGGIQGNVTGNINSTGVSTFASVNVTGNISIGGTLTYEDVTNVDSIGLVTARTGVRIDAGGLVVTAGVSTFTNGPVLVGTATSTGTASQRLQVTGGAYVSGSVGIGTTSPAVSLDLKSKTDAIALPQGTTAQRPTGNNPYIRYNTTNTALEFYNGTDWVEIISDYFPSGSTILG